MMFAITIVLLLFLVGKLLLALNQERNPKTRYMGSGRR
jgi:hypothetical protein